MTISEDTKTNDIDLPEDIPIFPLAGVLLLPRGDLPLNIFEPRYIAMINAALSSQRLIGMVQPSSGDAANAQPIYPIGCVGRITRFEETEDGRYLINLRGISRFRILSELQTDAGSYRRMKVSWLSFSQDTQKVSCLDIDRNHLLELLKCYFAIQKIQMNWDLIGDIDDDGLMTTLAMVCPFSPSEKQALLEAACCMTRAHLFVNLLEMAICKGYNPCDKLH
ncbi:MAG: LON peptidase substrate-binding domain-containing protein [Pseudomonadota bacterium]